MLGKLIEGDQQRDAIHVAIAPVIAADYLLPGQRIGLVPGHVDRAGLVDSPIGIVDPFLRKAVRPEEKFFMVLFPETTTNLRHNWDHPAFGQSEPTESPLDADDDEYVGCSC